MQTADFTKGLFISPPSNISLTILGTFTSHAALGSFSGDFSAKQDQGTEARTSRLASIINMVSYTDHHSTIVSEKGRRR